MVNLCTVSAIIAFKAERVLVYQKLLFPISSEMGGFCVRRHNYQTS